METEHLDLKQKALDINNWISIPYGSKELSPFLRDMYSVITALELRGWMKRNYPPRGVISFFRTHPHIKSVRQHPLIQKYSFPSEVTEFGMDIMKDICVNGFIRYCKESEWGQYVDIETGGKATDTVSYSLVQEP